MHNKLSPHTHTTVAVQGIDGTNLWSEPESLNNSRPVIKSNVPVIENFAYNVVGKHLTAMLVPQGIRSKSSDRSD